VAILCESLCETPAETLGAADDYNCSCRHLHTPLFINRIRVPPMRVLFIGGTGLISSGCIAATEAAGHELWLLNRGHSNLLPASIPAERTITADATDPQALREALRGHEFDTVVQWVGFKPDHVAQDVETFASAGQYVFISSASVYQKPSSHWLITEQTPLSNPVWLYAQEKIACERVLREAHAATGFPMTIIRPSHTYGPSQIPILIGSWDKPFTIVDRMRRGGKIIVTGDGTSLWTLTHNTDFAKGLVGLFGQPAAIGEDFHITSDEALEWNQVYELLGEAAGVELDILHVPSDAIVAIEPEQTGSLFGDKIHSSVFDNSKLRSVVPDFQATVPFSEGIKETIAWFDADPSRQAIDHTANELWDRIVSVYTDALRLVAE
jgi:nucleoside-diphosphate-sugar epimerase